MSFLNWFWGFWNWLFNMIRFKEADDSVSSSKERPWCDLAIEICKISRLDAPY